MFVDVRFQDGVEVLELDVTDEGDYKNLVVNSQTQTVIRLSVYIGNTIHDPVPVSILPELLVHCNTVY